MKVIALDIETTGLSPAKDKICELGLMEFDMTVLAPVGHKFERIIGGDGQAATIRTGPPMILKMHTQNGLLPLLEKARLTTHRAETQAINWMIEHAPKIDDETPVSEKPVLLGSSVHFDRAFLNLQMPELSKMFHYRHIDVSSIKELVKHWYPEVAQKMPDFPRSGIHGPAHRVIPDILYTVDELYYYWRFVFRKENSEMKEMTFNVASEG